MLPVMILVTEVWFFNADLHLSLWKRFSASRKAVKGILFILMLALVFMSVEVIKQPGGYAGRHFTMLERVLTKHGLWCGTCRCSFGRRHRECQLNTTWCSLPPS